jgi:hypothetical protein
MPNSESFKSSPFSSCNSRRYGFLGCFAELLPRTLMSARQRSVKLELTTVIETSERSRFVICSDVATITNGKSWRFDKGSSEAAAELKTSQAVTAQIGCKRVINCNRLKCRMQSLRPDFPHCGGIYRAAGSRTDNFHQYPSIPLSLNWSERLLTMIAAGDGSSGPSGNVI